MKEYVEEFFNEYKLKWIKYQNVAYAIKVIYVTK
jgi:hypothetical protein